MTEQEVRMLVVLTDRHVLATDCVCQNCPLADGSGHPRWQAGRLRCGHGLAKQNAQQADQFRCTMGFRLASIHFD
ncbi:hypothetical protein PCC6311_0199 [Synechococcus elongatus PCC 6311]|uniref:Uncharacterized protein n=3 Tax=Synechococcus elongatus TaxID=32046 RepID=Q31RU4_SYNE7|nr:hypothetical protein [Synechococcus elongatus]MBD2689125.1 hypothetical protein [Synechococcus elongatus FACHB-1061]UOW69975.1 hypothetical protein PCC7943_0199 [Synechococcus elongatus PCC 7943]UOW72696.1 hypothetical protein PCC6311_0199 [Synechococcus elongatus PCC 6311]UOW75417.1 hypothetical protein PCC6301pg_0199 [Synechococcus elongatus PCC 6301]ABB56225.1 conserved hypothetical protein [Synechococcus elongatus PCC 7942 = FACHB-805]